MPKLDAFYPCQTGFRVYVPPIQNGPPIQFLGWIRKILHDPRYLAPGQLWCYSIIRSCRVFNINSMKTTFLKTMRGSMRGHFTRCEAFSIAFHVNWGRVNPKPSSLHSPKTIKSAVKAAALLEGGDTASAFQIFRQGYTLNSCSLEMPFVASCHVSGKEISNIVSSRS